MRDFWAVWLRRARIVAPVDDAERMAVGKRGEQLLEQCTRFVLWEASGRGYCTSVDDGVKELWERARREQAGGSAAVRRARHVSRVRRPALDNIPRRHASDP